MNYTILVTNIMDKKYFVGNIYVCKDYSTFIQLRNGITNLFRTLNYNFEIETKEDGEDTIAYIRIERTPITNGSNDINN